jgi:superfamily II DNA or RNA helicase
MPNVFEADRISLRLTPNGRLLASSDADGWVLDADTARRVRLAFEKGSGSGLLQLGASEVSTALPSQLAWWRDFGSRWVTALSGIPELGDGDAAVPAPAAAELSALAASAPPMTGAEYLSVKVLRALWEEIGQAFNAGRAKARVSAPEFLHQLNPAWHVVGRVHFNLAENRKDDEAPFAFIATYTHRLSSHGKAQHLPLGQALREYSGAGNKQRLLSLLLPVQRAAGECDWLKRMVDAGEIFHPLRWSAAEAFRMLGDVQRLEQAGVIVRMPANWAAGRPARPSVTATIGADQPSLLGRDALLDFKLEVTLDGKPLSEAEVRRLLDGTTGLALIRGQWVELDRDRLARTFERLKQAEDMAARDGLGFMEAMRLLSGAEIAGKDGEEDSREWSQVVAGPWLAQTLKALRSPDSLNHIKPGRGLKGKLRPYQLTGVRWLHLLSGLGLGACLADDMGLGKTIQVISLLLTRRGKERQPSLLVAPASLLANWMSELERFAPGLRATVAHASFMPREELKEFDPAGFDLVVTSYGSLLRLPKLAETKWDLLVLDEAQAIKNSAAKQTRAAKKLQSSARIALTGTPIENRLGDLWSIFDFINPGLLGSARDFGAYSKRLARGDGRGYGPLRELVRPYILRRLKTDKSVISDLPDKTEVKTFCPLSRKQAALYSQSVDELAQALETLSGMERRGVILAFLMRFKQICNHPSQWLGDHAWSEPDSGKFARLRELCEVIAAKQEKVLVFTQFRETTAPLASFLGSVFEREGLVLHGQTPVRRRKEMVKRFQEDETVPFFILSLKAGGSGLNLTAASHVIHFDRWWNPAVENQATDRAFRIGQTKNVLVHKFVCRGTVEQKIDELIESKKKLSNELLEGGGEINLTEMKDEELLRLVSLDLNAVLQETA